MSGGTAAVTRAPRTLVSAPALGGEGSAVVTAPLHPACTPGVSY